MAIVKKYLAEIVYIENKVEGIYAVELKSLVGPFKYFPGQFLHLALDEYDFSSGWPESRCFSMQSSPDQENILITYAVKGVFTSRMSKELIIGRRVMLKLPYGDLFVQEHSKVKTVFIAGGTGITPFLSLFNDSSFSKYLSPKIYLGFRNEAYNLYQTELSFALKNHERIHRGRYCPIVTITYENISGKIDIEKIFHENSVESTYFISGPPQMINIFKDIFKQKGVLDKHIKTDDWS